ncbi:MAG: acyltransferase family protein [Muribaculaceae bacterium]|nr:acyltransferase family protein [Muribaculaceae bacterium]
MERDHSLDSLKGFLIILVVIGHVITILDNANVINHAVMGLIYSFHMPLFILISGYLTKPASQQSEGKLWRGVLDLMVTIVIFQLLTACRLYLTGKDPVEGLLDFPHGILWYLMCLVYWKIIFYYSPKALVNRPVLYISLAFLVSLLSGLTTLGNLLSIQRALNFYPFFLMGHYIHQRKLNDKWLNCNLSHLAIAVILLPLIFWLYPRCGKVLNGADHYPFAEIPQKAAILVCSTALTLLVFNLRRDVKWLRPIGKDSLFYYLYHYLILALVVFPVVERFNLPHNLAFVLLYTAVIMGILLLLHKVKFLRWLTRPTANHHNAPR